MSASVAHEPVCLAIVALYVIARAREDGRPGRLALRLLAIAAGAWLGEETMIRAYGFYHYTTERWTVMLDRVPLLVTLIWPVVIHSGWDLAGHLLDARAAPGRARARLPLAVFALVLSDAVLIEPIAVAAGLWEWTAPGLFGVPPIGVIGWAVFAALCLALLARWPDRPATLLGLMVLAPALTHPILIALWWGGLRWVSAPIPPAPAIAAIWLVAIATAVALRRAGAAGCVPMRVLWLRLPGALFFGVLLALYGPAEPALFGWALAFPIPYLALMLGRPAESARDAAVDRLGEADVGGRAVGVTELPPQVGAQ